MFKRRAFLSLILGVALVLAGSTTDTSSAYADGAAGCDETWYPASGAVSTTTSGSITTATFAFILTPGELANLQCVAPLLEIDFHLEGVQVPPQWDDYIVPSTNLPGAIHDVAAGDFNSSTPGVTNIKVRGDGGLQAGRNYWVTIAWQQLAAKPGETPGFWMGWVPSHIADLSEPWNQIYCAVAPYSFYGQAWCVFATDPSQATVYLGPNSIGINQLNLGGNSVHAFGSWPTSPFPPDVPLLPTLSSSFSFLPYLSMVGSIPDGYIIQSSDANLYVTAGGRLFRFDKNNAGMLNAFRAQMQQKYGSTVYLPMDAATVRTLEVNRTSAGVYSPGSNMPSDNTFMYEYGTTQQYVVKFQHPFSIGDTDELVALGGQNKAVVVPPGLGDLQTYPPQWVQNDLLRFWDDPTVWHYAGSQGFRVPGVPTRDCLQVRWNRGVTVMPASAWNYFPTHVSQQAACDFADGQWLFGTPSNRQIVTMYGAGYYVGSSQEVIALGGLNKAVPVVDETVTGLLARTGLLPNNELVKSYNDPRVYQVVANKLHYVGSPATRDCLSARSGKTVRTVPIDLIGRMQANGQTGSDAYCELENRQLLGPNGTSVVYIQNGYKRPVGNPNIRNCIAVRTGAGQPVAVSDNVWNSYAVGANAYCPYETELGLNFVQEAGDPTVWLVGPPATPGQPGVKRHAGNLCVPDPYTTQLKKFHVWTVPVGETAGHVQGPDFWASGAGCGALSG